MWMRSFVVAVVVSIPITFAAIPLVRKILSRVQVRS